MFDFSNPDNPILDLLRKISNVIILNLIFIVSCIPVITIGASISALYTVCFQITRQEDPYIWKSYWKAFRQNFRQSTCLWLICVPVIAILFWDFLFLQQQTIPFASVVQMLVWAVAVLALSMFHFLFPAAAHFICTIPQCFKNALLMSLGHAPYALVFLMIDGIVLYCAMASVRTLGMVFMLYLICGFSCIALIKSIFFIRIFRHYDPKPDQEA